MSIVAVQIRAVKGCPMSLWVKSRHVQCKRHVRFTPNSDRESEIPQKAMSALHPIADICGATRDVRFGPKADIETITSVLGVARPLAAKSP
jgi:hypothetical protein